MPYDTWHELPLCIQRIRANGIDPSTHPEDTDDSFSRSLRAHSGTTVTTLPNIVMGCVGL
jgi:hypothetical protein